MLCSNRRTTFDARYYRVDDAATINSLTSFIFFVCSWTVRLLGWSRAAGGPGRIGRGLTSREEAEPNNLVVLRHG